MKQLRVIAPMILFLLFSILAWAQRPEPHDHPVDHPGSEKDSPAARLAAKKERERKAILEKIDKSIQAYIQKQSMADSYFHVPDPVLSKTWDLTLDKVHKDKLTPLSEGKYFACVDFKSEDGTVVDVDFFLADAGKELKVTDTSVHKVDSVARYMYEEKDGYWTRVESKAEE